MKYAYNRYVRPANDIFQKDPEQRSPLEGLVQEDYPEDSFPLLASQELDRPATPVNVPIIPGLPPIVDNRPKTGEYEVERVIRGRYKNRELQYLIKWKGFPNSRNTWEPEKNLNSALLDCLKSHPVKITGKM